MKIAVPTQETMVDGHFGHCEAFTVFTVDNKEITAREMVRSPAGCGCKSDIAATLAQMGVTTLLAGNMGQGAVDVCARSGISVVRGCSGDVEQAALRWIEGSLTDNGTPCSDHSHGCHHE
jgi:predicted Fe-Mo cluster-binding NifX family protein